MSCVKKREKKRRKNIGNTIPAAATILMAMLGIIQQHCLQQYQRYFRPAKSGEWRKCHLQNFLDYAEICQHKLNKTKEIYAFFLKNSGYFGKFLILWKSFIGNYNKTREAFDCVEVFSQNLQHKGDISFNKKT